MKKVAFHNLGCKVNAYEMDVMRQSLSENGFLIVPFDQKADVYIVNTCSVTNIADRKTRQMLHRARGVNPNALIVAAGCYVDTHDRERILADGVDLALVNKEKLQIASILQEKLKAVDSGLAEELNPDGPDPEPNGSDAYAHTRAWLKCQDGCNMFCSYCIIPYARGRIRSRRIRDICEEAADLAEAGFREFVLTGIHLSSYGLDRPAEKEDLLSLIRALSLVDGVMRIRLGSLEPGIISEDFADTLAGISKFCPQFHLSLQSGCDSVLKRMNRKYTTEEYYKSVCLLRKSFDRPALTTDIIVGFPGETEEEFNKTVSFVKRVGFYETHIFKYSRRKGTVADRMPCQLTDAVKSARSDILLSLHAENKNNYLTSFLDGHTVELLTEEPQEIDGEEYMTGYTREYIRAALPLKEQPVESGRILRGTLTRILKNGVALFQSL